jgi:hypothetical protein
MLAQLVRPMVQTQLRLLANCQATRATLVNTVAQWLGFLGVQAQVTHLEGAGGRIHIALTVGRPEACDPQDWQRILHKLEENDTHNALLPQQQTKLSRLLAYLIQVGEPDQPWEALHPRLQQLGLEEGVLLGIHSALKIPQSLEHLLDGLEPEVAAVALPKAMSIALLDKQVNSSEHSTLHALLEVMGKKMSC